MHVAQWQPMATRTVRAWVQMAARPRLMGVIFDLDGTLTAPGE
jgi:hypothetical protein